MKFLALLALLLIPGYAHAGLFDSLLIIGAAVLGGPAGWSFAAKFALGVALASYGAYQQSKVRNQQRAAQQAQRDAYNSSLQDRTITSVTTEAPHVTVYGRARVGSAVVAIFNTGDRDQFQHLVCIHAAHQCEAIEEVYIAGKALGTLNADGFALNSEYVKNTEFKENKPGDGSSFTINEYYVPGTVRLYENLFGAGRGEPFTQVGNVITPNAPSSGGVYIVIYQVRQSTVRVKKHLGNLDDPADPTLISEVPSKWNTNSKLTGYCYTYIRLDINQQEFQSGIPSIEVLLNGKNTLLDPRDNSIGWSDNPAICLYDFLQSEHCNIPAADIPTAPVIAAANICDTVKPFGALYTINGAVGTDKAPADAIEEICQSMAGGINATTWEMWAGAYSAPVMTLQQTDIVGTISVTPGISDSETYNGVKGRYIGAENDYVSTDAVPYQNAVYLAEDGRELYAGIEYPWTNTVQRVHNLARIFVEDQRNSFTVKGIFSNKGWDLRINDRIQLNAAFFGFTNKVFRVVEKTYNPSGTVELTLKEDTAEIWDLADAVVADATPNTDLPSPFNIQAPGAPAVIEELYETTGTAGVKARAIVSWNVPSVRATAYRLEYKLTSQIVWTELPVTSINEQIINDIQPGTYQFRVRAENTYFISVSDYSPTTTKEIQGLSALPENIQNLNVIAIAGRALASWDLTTDLDVRIGGRVVIRHSPLSSGVTWEDTVILEEFNGDAVNGNLPLLTGTYFAKFRDSTGNYSDTAASFVATEALVTGYVTTDTVTEHPDFVGVKTNLAAIEGVLKLDSSMTIDDMLDSMDDWGEIDSLGGLVSSGTYMFDGSMNFGAVQQRKIDANVKAFSYNASNIVDYWTDIDSLDSIDGGVINDTDAIIYYRATNDDPTGTPTWTAWTQFMVADVNCWGLEFKAELISANTTHQIEFSELSVRAREAV